MKHTAYCLLRCSCIVLNNNTVDRKELSLSKEQPEMTAEDVVAFVRLCKEHGIDIIIDGGWSVDALLGEQTRRHEDLDVVVQHKDVTEIRTLLSARGYSEVQRDDSWECNFVLGDAHGHLIDIHSCTFDIHGQQRVWRRIYAGRTSRQWCYQRLSCPVHHAGTVGGISHRLSAGCLRLS